MKETQILEEKKSDKLEYPELCPLTGLYYNKAFFRKADEKLLELTPDTYCLLALDMEHFRLFNKLYGRDAGDELLVYIADCLRQAADEQDGVAGYLGGDNFAILMPDVPDEAEKLKNAIIQGIQRWNTTVGFLPAIGIYSIDDISVSAVSMYDYATIALAQVIGNYTKRICRYDSGMEEKIEEEIKLLSEIQEGLEQEEFTFYAQPQCDIATGKIVGAESLVRWVNREKGLISPGVFIPVLEKNGFIADLDRYVWRKVCEWLRSWIDRGYHPVPVSINVSRIDIFSMDVPAYLIGLLKEYNLSEKLIKIEITESAYAESNDKIINTVKELHEAGFLVMMDDFGSGYSSLNMLKNVAVDVIKLDMRFLDIDEKEEERGIGILESVVNMARQLGLPIIVEGVETQKQEKFLAELGCRYTQGFYYYRPLPIRQFEDIISDERNLDFDGMWCRQVEALHVREFLDDNLFSDRMLNSILGAMAFYDMYENQIQITRVNNQYYELAGISSETDADYEKKFWNHVRDDDRQKLYSIFEQAYEKQSGGAQGHVHFVRADGKVLWIYLRVYFIREKEGHKLFCSSLVDMTAMREKKKQNAHFIQQMTVFDEKKIQSIEQCYGDLPAGYGVGKVSLDEDGNPRDYDIIYANHEMEKICGGDIQRLRHLAVKIFGNNKEELLDKAYQAAYLGETVNHYAYSSVSNRYLTLTFYQFEYGYVGCMMRDNTHMHVYEDALRSIMYSYREVYYVHMQDNYCRIIYPDENRMLESGNYEETVNRHFGTGKIRPYNMESVRKDLSLDNLREVLKRQDSVEYRYWRMAPNGEEERCITNITVSEREAGEPKTAIMTIRSIEQLMRDEEEQRRQHMAETLANMSDGFFVYRAAEDEKILYANPAVLQMYGCDTMKEFRAVIGNSFRDMVHPEDVERVEYEIRDQIKASEGNMDYIRYRIIRKDGEIRWIDDCGHLEDSDFGEDGKLFYVFISDITDTISIQQKEKLLYLNKHYQK